ncbi:MAG TPA: penicillin-binding transpeptidase domain-containing protein [Acidimicrobiales bacterium]
MSSRYRLVALVGVVLLGAAVYATYALMRDDTPTPDAAVEAYLDDWSAGDFTAMEARVVDPPATFVDDHRAVVDELGVTAAAYELDSVDTGGSTGVARYTATLELAGIGDWTYSGTLPITEDPEGDVWLIEWSPANVHPALDAGHRLDRTRDAPERAPILDAAGQSLSTGRPAKLIGLEPRAVDDLDAVKVAFQSELDIEPAAIDEALGAPGVQPDHFVPITTVALDRYEQVEPVIYPLPGTRFRDTTLRGGPTPGFAAHVIGRYGEITAERLDELGGHYQAGDLVGLSGLEGRFEEQLAGTPSSTVVVVDANGEVVEEIERFEGRAPEPVRTSIDPAVQLAVESALGDVTSPAAAVVVDSKSNVRAVASRPLADFNRALGGEYPPGSTFKIVTTAALLANGVTPETPVACTETVNAGGRNFKNFERSSLGTVPFGLAFAESCNTAFIAAAADVPDSDLVAAAESFGFNAAYSVGLDTGTASFPIPEDATEHAAATIGQGRVTASPLHMATVAGTVIDGTWEPPVLLPDLEVDEPAQPTTLAGGTSETLMGLMRRVVAEGSGTAAAVPGADIAGKTGTAEYGTGDPPPTHAWFVGIRGDLAVAVLVEGGEAGGTVAAPIAGEILAALPG